MSAATDLDAILSHVDTNITQLIGDSNTMVNDAIAAINAGIFIPPVSPPNDNNVMSIALTQTADTPAAFPVWAQFPEVTFPALQEIDPIVFNPNATFPFIYLTDHNYYAPAALESFSSAAPLVNTDFTLPATPSVERDTALPERPQLTAITTPSFNLSSPRFAPIAIDAEVDPETFEKALQQFSQDIFNGAGGLSGLESLLKDSTVWGDRVLNTVLPLLLDQVNQQLTDKYSPVLAFQTQLRQRLTERLTAETQRVQQTLQNRSGWDLPIAVQNALTATVEQIAQSWNQQAESLADTQAAELALDFFETCGELFSTFNNGIQTLKSKELEYTLETHRMALAYAKTSIAALLSQYELETFTQQDIAFKTAEAQLKVFEAELQVALLRYDIAKAQLQAEQSQQDNDAALIQLYQSETEAASADIRIYTEQVAAARAELELKALPIELFAMEVKAFDAQISAYEAQLSAQVAELDIDQAKIDAELAKVTLFEAQAKGFERLMATRRQIVEAQDNRNEAILAEFTAKVDEQLYEAKKLLSENRYEVAKFRVLADDSIADANYQLTEARTILRLNKENQDNSIKAYRLTKENNVELATAELDRIAAIADVNAMGASVMAQMATGAMSAATGIANVVLQETA